MGVQQWLGTTVGRAHLDSSGRVSLADDGRRGGLDKLRDAYEWLSTRMLPTGILDIEFGETIRLGRAQAQLELRNGGGYSSFILLPLLTLLTERRLLLVGPPGRGKTTIASFMGQLAGYSRDHMRTTIQHGHPQLGQADLLGSPLPSQLVTATRTADIEVHWRQWLSSRVKVIDEYNRIPTKTQSVLLSLMAEGYAEMYEHTVTTDHSAWFLTANDSGGGGTFPIIEALKDRIDAVVRCPSPTIAAIEAVTRRVQAPASEDVPCDLVLTSDELAAAQEDVRAIPFSASMGEFLSFFSGLLGYCRQASRQLELQTKDSLSLSGRRVADVCNESCPLDKQEHLCAQVERGFSVRTIQSLVHYAKALAHFRGNPEVTPEDVRELLPWILHDKLAPAEGSPFFDRDGNSIFLIDRIGWIRQLFEKARAQWSKYHELRLRLRPLRSDEWMDLTSLGLEELESRIATVQGLADQILKSREMNGSCQEDLLLLKSVQSRLRHRMIQIQRMGG